MEFDVTNALVSLRKKKAIKVFQNWRVLTKILELIYELKNKETNMKNQPQNQGELKELKVMIEKDVVESFERMTNASGLSLSDLVVIALKRFRSSHSDWDVKPNSNKQ